ncbi:MAG TPA: tetratricopeptide repeat protein [Bacteroidota bacterium]|nr:tetratricopeptide repeat protein [Bacteroidota bacterium]
MEKNRGLLAAARLCLAAAATAWMAGCGAGEKAAVAPAPYPSESPRMDYRHEAALSHFIAGSVYEVKGEFAQAALEYLEALRADTNHAMYYGLAKCYTALNKPALAIDAAREAVRLAPGKTEYRKLLADIEASSYALDSAAAQYEYIVAHDSSNVEAWYDLARVYQAAQKPLKALETYERFTARFGPEWDVLLQTADLCNKLGEPARAADALRQMVDLDPANKELRRTMAQTQVRAGDLDGALATYGDLRDMDPANLSYQAEVAGVWLLKKDYRKAADLFDPILKRDTVSADVKVHIGELYYGQMEKDTTLVPVTEEVFEKVRDANPTDWRPYWFLGGIASAKKDDSLAVKNFRKVTELASWNADGWVFLSSVYLTKNDFSHTVSILEAAVKAVPEDFRVNFFLGIAYSRLGRNPDAARVLEKARQISPRDTEAIAQLALVYDSMKKNDESDSLYEEALRINPNFALVLNNYAYSLSERGIQLERALKMARRALDAAPDNASYLDTMGWIYYQLGKYRDAETYVKKAIAKGEVSAVVHEHMGDIYFRLNDTERALEHWNEALKLDEHNTILREKISRRSL